MPAPEAILNDHDGLAAAATAVAEVFGLGDTVTVSDQWPVDDGDTVLAGMIEGELVGCVYLAVNDAVADRLSSDPGRLTSGLQKALDELNDRHGTALTIGEVGRTDERPDRTVEIADAQQLCALVGFGLVAENAELDAAADGGPVSGGPVDESGAGVADTADPVLAAAAAAARAGAPTYQPESFPTNGHGGVPDYGRSGALDVLQDVDMEVTVELGRTRMPIRELLSLQPGMVIEIDRAAGAPIDVLVNGRMIACGEVVVVDEEFGIRITEIVGAPA